MNFEITNLKTSITVPIFQKWPRTMTIQDPSNLRQTVTTVDLDELFADLSISRDSANESVKILDAVGVLPSKSFKHYGRFNVDRDTSLRFRQHQDVAWFSIDGDCNLLRDKKPPLLFISDLRKQLKESLKSRKETQNLKGLPQTAVSI